MNVRHLSRSFLLSFGLALCLAAPAWAVNHNPTTQQGTPTRKSTKVDLKNPTFTNGSQSYTATIQIDPGQYPELLKAPDTSSGTLVLSLKDSDGTSIAFSVGQNGAATTYNVQDSDIGTSENPNTITCTVATEACKSCKYHFELSGLTGGVATSSDVTPSAGGGGPPSNNSIDVSYDLGTTPRGFTAGKLMLYANAPSDSLYTPALLKTFLTDASTEVISKPLDSSDPNSPLAIRQVLSATRFTDIVTVTPGQSYQVNIYNASGHGAKDSDGLYPPVGTPIKTSLIENPGPTSIANTTDAPLYYNERFEKSFSYEIPVRNGPCKVQLYFAELYQSQAGATVFNVKAEGTNVLSNYDPFVAAGGRDTARIEDVSTSVSDGGLSLAFDTVQYGAHVSALKVTRDSTSAAISGTNDSDLYQSARFGTDFSYAVPVSATGDYQVTLSFAETAYAATGKRVFNVAAEGSAVLSNYDLYAQAGANTAKQETFTVNVTDGELDLHFTGITDEALVSGIVVKAVSDNSLVAAIHAGGAAYTATDGTVFLADTDFTGGTAEYPGRVITAINAGGDQYTAADGTVFQADTDFTGGFSYNGVLNSLKVTDQEAGGNPTVYLYSFITEPRTGQFTECLLSHAGGLKVEGKSTIWAADGQSYDEIRTLRDSAGNLVSKTDATYEESPFGTRQTKQVVDPDGVALTTTWTYVAGSDNPADPKPNGYGQVLLETDPNGYWQQYSYDSANRVSKIVSQYLNSVSGDEANSKVETITYGTSNPVEAHVVTVLGQEVSRTYIAEFDDPTNNEFERWNITAATPGAAWDASDNLVSKTRLYKSSNPTALLQGQTKWTRRPDGTMTFYSYAMSGATKVVTADTGSPNTGLTAITAGTRTVTTTNAAGQTIAQDTIDIASGLTLQSWSALTIDDLGRPTEIGYGDGTTKSIVYEGSSAACGTCSSSGNFLVASETDRNGVTTTYAYDALNRRTDTTRLGVTTHVIYDAAGRVLETHRIGTDSSDIRVAKTVYDLAGRVTETDDALGNATTVAYTYPTAGGLVTTTTYPATAAGSGTRIETTYDDGKTTSIAGTAVSPINYAYGVHSLGEWTQEIKVGDAGATTEWTKTYTDLAGRTLKTEYPDAAVAIMAYNALGQLMTQTDPDGVQTLFAYNAKGEREVTALDLNRDGVIDYAGADRITKTVRDVVSQSGTVVNRTTTQVWATDSSNTATTVSIATQDGYGNNSTQTDAAGATSSMAIARTSAGAWTSTSTAPDGSQQVQTYASGLLASTTRKDSSGGQVTNTGYAYDAHNRIATQTDARTGAVAYTYTARDEVLTVKANNNTETTTTGYDALGNLLTRTLPDSSVTTNTYYLFNNQLKKTSGSQTYPVEYTYDPQGRMKTLTTWQNATTPAGAAVTTWAYDTQRGWLTQKLYADNTGPSYTYTAAGRLETRTWVRTVSSAALVTTYGYNTAGDLESTDYSDTTPDVSLTYTRFGAQKTVTDATGTRTLTYNAALRPDQERLDATYYGSRLLTRTYETSGDTIGRSTGFKLGVTGALDQDYAVTYGYDSAGRLGTVTDPSGTFTYGYTTNSNLRHTLTGPVHTATTTYETYRDVLDTLENKVGSTSVSKYDYLVNNLGQRKEREQSGTAFSATNTDVFGYNGKGEVTGSTNAVLTARNTSFAYDDIGNRTSVTDGSGTTGYTASTLNQYTLVSSAVPVFDADGNMTATGAGQLYVWDAENRLISIEPVTPTTGDKKQLNTYDGQSRRVRKQVYAYASGAWALSSDEKYLYDGWNLAAVYDAASSNALLRTYTWGIDLSGSLQGAGGVGGLLFVKDGSATYYYTYDANGNVSEVLDSSGAIAAHYEYDAFGNTVASSGTYAATNAYRFSTKPVDDVSGLYYYGLRYYNPGSGRWINRDPIGEKGGRNLYAMVGNQPINTFDILGKLGKRGGSYVPPPPQPPSMSSEYQSFYDFAGKTDLSKYCAESSGTGTEISSPGSGGETNDDTFELTKPKLLNATDAALRDAADNYGSAGTGPEGYEPAPGSGGRPSSSGGSYNFTGSSHSAGATGAAGDAAESIAGYMEKYQEASEENALIRIRYRRCSKCWEAYSASEGGGVPSRLGESEAKQAIHDDYAFNLYSIPKGF